MASRSPPRPIDTTGGAIRWRCGCSLGSACLPIGSPSHPFGSTSDGDGGVCACLVRLPLPIPAPWPSSVPPATRSLAQSDFLAVRPSYRPASPSSHRLPSPITRHVGRGGGFSLSAACLCCSISPAVDLRGFCECGGGGCLACLAVVLCICRWGDVVARRFVSGL